MLFPLAGTIIYKQPVVVKRLQRDARDADLEGYVTIYNGIQMNIQPAGLSYAALMANGEMGKIYMAYTTYSGIKIGMQVIASGSPTVSGMAYAVEGVEEWNGPLGMTYQLLLRLKVK